MTQQKNVPDGPTVEETDILVRDFPVYWNEFGYYTFHRDCGWSYPEGSGRDSRLANHKLGELLKARTEHARTCDS